MTKSLTKYGVALVLGLLMAVLAVAYANGCSIPGWPCG